MTHAAESTHYYSRDGLPAYEVKARDGSMRPTTLRDAKKLNLVPSVTTIIKCAAAPGLERWKSEQVLLAALTLPRFDGESDTEYSARVMRDSREQARKAAERGTTIHAAIQGIYEARHPGPELIPYATGADDALVGWLKKPSGLVVEAERSFAHRLGFGGKVDLHGGKPDFVLDFKTKEFSPDDDLKTWDEHHMQLAAYREGLNLPKARCAICYVSVTHPGLARVLEIPEEDLQRGWKCFAALLEFWKAKNRYDPSKFERKAA